MNVLSVKELIYIQQYIREYEDAATIRVKTEIGIVELKLN